MTGLFATVLLIAGADALQPRAVVYGYPLSTLGMSNLGNRPPVAFYGVVGTSVRLSEAVGVDAEVAGGSLAGTTGWIASLGTGPSVQLTGEDAFRGLFLATRVRFEAFRPPGHMGPTPAGSGPVAPPSPTLAALGELDVGYHLLFGRFYFAPVIGVGVGFAFNFGDPTGFGLLMPTNPRQSPRPGIVWSLNLNLARLGVAI